MPSHGEGWLMDRYMAAPATGRSIPRKVEAYRAHAGTRRGCCRCFAITASAWSRSAWRLHPARRPVRDPADAFQPPHRTTITSRSASRWCRARRSSRPQRVADQVARDRRQAEPDGRIALFAARQRRPAATSSSTLKKDRKRHQRRVRAADLAPTASSRSPTRASTSSRRTAAGGGSGRDITIMLGGDDPVLLDSTAQRIVEQMATAARAASRRASTATCSGPKSRSGRASTSPPISASPPRR